MIYVLIKTIWSLTFIFIYIHYIDMYIKTTPNILNNWTTLDMTNQEIIRKQNIYINLLEKQIEYRNNKIYK